VPPHAQQISHASPASDTAKEEPIVVHRGEKTLRARQVATIAKMRFRPKPLPESTKKENPRAKKKKNINLMKMNTILMIVEVIMNDIPMSSSYN
jgi:hypothetical protein